MIPGVTFHSRESWQAPNEPVRGPYAYEPARVLFGMAHYTASNDLIDGDPGESADDLPQYLRNIQHSYLTHRGYSLGYSFAVDWLGGVWEVRGFDYRPAANDGDKGEWEVPNLNRFTVAVLYLVDGDDRLTAEAAAAGRAIYREAHRRTVSAGGEWTQFSPKPHHETDYTACPGNGITRDISEGRLTFDPFSSDPEGGEVVPVGPVRMSDTRKYGFQLPVGWHRFKVADVVPRSASAVWVTLTATEADGPGYVSVGPPSLASGVPAWSNLNYHRDNVANTTLARVEDGWMSVYVRTPTHLVVDVLGYVG